MFFVRTKTNICSNKITICYLVNKITNICYFDPKPEQNNKYLLNICYFVILFPNEQICSLLFVILLRRTEQNNKMTNICSSHDLLTKTKKSEENTCISCFFMTPPRNRTTESLGCRSRWMGIMQTSGNGPPLHSRANTEYAYTGADNSCKKDNTFHAKVVPR